MLHKKCLWPGVAGINLLAGLSLLSFHRYEYIGVKRLFAVSYRLNANYFSFLWKEEGHDQPNGMEPQGWGSFPLSPDYRFIQPVSDSHVKHILESV